MENLHEDGSDAKGLRWLEVRVLDLESALVDSRAEAATLNEYLELCFDMIANQDQRLSEQQLILQKEVDGLLGRSSDHQREILDLRSTNVASVERLDLAAAEFASMASDLADQAGASAALNAERIELLKERILALNEELRAAAQQLEDELRDADEEIRVMAEKAADRADFSTDTVSGLQADLDEESAAIWEKLKEVATHEELQEVEHHNREAARLAAELLESADSRTGATAEQIDGIALSIQKEVAREMHRLRRTLDAEAGYESADVPMQRFRYYLPEEAAPEQEPKELTENSGSHDGSKAPSPEKGSRSRA